MAEVKLLLPEEIAAMRADLGAVQSAPLTDRWDMRRIVATLEALQAERDEARGIACGLFDDDLQRDVWSDHCSAQDIQRRIVSSDHPEWLRPLETFYEINPWCRPSEESCPPPK